MHRPVMTALGMLMPLACAGPPPSPRCVDDVVVDDFVEVSTQAELESLAGCEELQALVVRPPTGLFDEPVIDLSPLSSLRVVRTILSLRVPDVTSLAPLAGLRAVGSVDDEGAGAFSLQQSGVETLAGLEGLGSDGNLQEVQLLDNARLRSLVGLPALARLEEMTVNGASALTDLGGLEGVASIGTLRLGFTAVTTFNGLADDVVIDALIVRQPAFAEVVGLPAGARFGLIAIDLGDRLVDVDLGAVDVVGVDLADLSALNRVTLPATPRAPSSLRLKGLPGLERIDGLAPIDVATDVAVVACTRLAALPFDSLTHVTGNLRITGNTALSQADLEAALADVVVDGARKIAGNAGWVVPDICPFSDDGSCDEPEICAPTTDGQDCEPTGG